VGVCLVKRNILVVTGKKGQKKKKIIEKRKQTANVY